MKQNLIVVDKGITVKELVNQIWRETGEKTYIFIYGLKGCTQWYDLEFPDYSGFMKDYGTYLVESYAKDDNALKINIAQ